MSQKRFHYIVTHPISVLKALLSYMKYSWRFKEYHLSDKVLKPLYITPRYISLGDHVYIGHNARINGVRKYNNVNYSPRIELSDGVSIQQGIHMTCANYIHIGKNTAIAAYVTITDIIHPYTDVNIPIERQDLEVKSVIIGEDCKINNGVVILPGVSIGKHVTIGANSVVTKSIPDYCVVVGSPARIIKQYNPNIKQWETPNI